MVNPGQKYVHDDDAPSVCSISLKKGVDIVTLIIL